MAAPAVVRRSSPQRDDGGRPPSPWLRRLVEPRFFASLPSEEIAPILGLPSRTVERDWVVRRADRLALVQDRDGFLEQRPAPR